ncbi:MAG: Clp protease N-terminal domain-containing protein [Actinomycetia bacterium]|nr:Clp protease N-terminal domain-containing protein [Actinomycetes bacterium]
MSETISFTPRMGECIVRAGEIAKAYGQSHVGTEHVLMAFLRDEHSIAAQMIDGAGNGRQIADALDVFLRSATYNNDSQKDSS